MIVYETNYTLIYQQFTNKSLCMKQIIHEFVNFASYTYNL